MRLHLLLVCLLATSCFAQSPRVPFQFDAGLGAQPARTQQKLGTLEGKLPSTYAQPSNFQELASAPDGVTTPTTRLWLAPQLAAAYARAADAGVTPMVWPGTVHCAAHEAFVVPATTLLASGAGSSCTAFETNVRAQLSTTTLATCLDVDLPERFVSSGLVPPGLSQGQLNSLVDTRTQTLEGQLALAGAGLQLAPVPEGLLPGDWVPTMRSVLWKLRATTHATAISQARLAYTNALSTMSTNAACFDAAKKTALEGQLAQLDAELVSLSSFLSDVIVTGTQRAAQQSMCLATRSRVRPSLPVPALTDEEREFVAFWLGGTFWRMRGGGLLQLGSTQNARTFFARRPLREIARLANGTTTGDRAADSLYCAVFDGWGEWMDMGTTAGGQDMYEDLVQMTDRGRQQVADWTISSVGAALGNGLSNSKSAEAYLRDANFNTTELMASGLSMGPCYLYALNPMKNFAYPSTTLPAPYSGFLDSFTAQGEFCFGASLGLGLTKSFLAGTPNNLPPANFCGARQCGVDACGVSCGACGGGASCNASGMCVGALVDAGVSVDAGLEPVDAGSVVADAGTSAVDAGAPDAGSAAVDAGGEPMVADAGAMTSQPPTGCGCGQSSGSVAMLALLIFTTRRRATRRRG